MTAKTTEKGTAGGVAAEESSVVTEAKVCQSRNAQRGDKCRDVNVNCDDISSSDGGGGSGVGGGEDKNNEPQHSHGGNIPQQHHNNKRNHHHHQSHGDETSYQLEPPDGGWGWMVALGTCIIKMMLPMTIDCFSVIFSEYLLEAGSSSATTSWIFNLQGFLWNTSALLASPLTQEFGWRLMSLTGSALTAAGLMISAFTPSPSFLFVSYSLLTGIGAGMGVCLCFTILPQYFQRRLGLANAIMMMGYCTGQLTWPLTIRLLQVSYAFRGATLILGALVFNACVGASLFHPFQWHQKKVPLKKEPQEDTPAFPTELKVVSPPDLSRSLVTSPSEASFLDTAAQAEIKGGMVFKKRLSEHLGGRRMSFSSSKGSSRYNSILSLYSLGVGSYAALPVKDEQEEEDHGEERWRDIFLVRVVRSIIKNLGAVKSLRVCIMCLGHMMCIVAHTNFLMMAPFAMQEAGFSLDASAWCLSVLAGGNMVTRFLVSTLSDWPRFNKRLVYMLGFVLLASSIFAFTFASSVYWMMITMGLYGIGFGANLSLFHLLIIDVVGVDHLGPVYGTSCFSVAIGNICIGPFIGFIRDATKSYAISMSITGGMMLVGLTGWLCMGLAERVDRRREEGKTLTVALQKT